MGVVGYAGADVDLRTGLGDALLNSEGAVWFARPDDESSLNRRFAKPIAAGKLKVDISDRPDLAALRWGQSLALTEAISPELWADADRPIERTPLRAQYQPNPLVRGRVLDDFGRVLEARRMYAAALRQGPRRLRATKSLYTSGLIHGAPWRRPALAVLNAACLAPLPWRWPHRHRLPYLTWNVPPDQRLPVLERSLAATRDDRAVLLSAANAAKEVDPHKAVSLARVAQQDAIARKHPSDAAWATFTLSFALRWMGDIEAAAVEAAQLADGYDALAAPGWVAWGQFELGAIAALVIRR